MEAVGSDSVWKVGDRVLIQYSNWIDGFDVPDLVGLGGKGAGSVQGTLREYGVFVSLILRVDLFFSIFAPHSFLLIFDYCGLLSDVIDY